VKIPLQAHFANKDDWCTPQVVDAFEKAMKEAGKSLELFRYDAEHAFVNEQRMSVHDRKAAELAWDRATEFFQEASGVSGFLSLRGAKRRSNPFFRCGPMDCFAEPVIGRAFARPVGSSQ